MKSIGYQYFYFYQFHHLLICAADKNRSRIRTTKSFFFFFFFFCSGYYRQQLVWVFLLLSLFLVVLWQVSIFRHFSHSSCHYSHLHPTNIYTSKEYKVYLDIYCQAHNLYIRIHDITMEQYRNCTVNILEKNQIKLLFFHISSLSCSCLGLAISFGIIRDFLSSALK